MAIDESDLNYEHPLYPFMEKTLGLTLATTSVDALLNWSAENSLWIFPMATSCCAIELMTAAASRVDLDQMGSIIRPSPKHADVMVVAGTITVKMAPRVRKLWDQMPEPKWCIAMGSCAISGDFYRDIYSVVPGVDTIVPVDVYIPGCPPNADQLMVGLRRLQEKVRLKREGKLAQADSRPERDKMIYPEVGRVGHDDRSADLSAQQHHAARSLGLGGNEHRENDDTTTAQGGVCPSCPHKEP